MSYTIQYYGTKEQKMAAALEDAKDYLGQTAFDSVLSVMGQMLQTEGVRAFVKQYAFVLSFAGIQGAPARAIALQTLRSR